MANPVGHVRPLGLPHDVTPLLHLGLARSPTFRTLVDQIERSSVTVYVRLGHCQGGVAACLHFLGASSGERFARVTLDRFGRSELALCVLLAHELQHAAELIDAPDVHSQEDFERFMERLGYRSRHGFETSQAVRTARQVERELAARSSEPEGSGR